ncbi:MAG TPA: HlyD family efflux transporter periplasmic adaptor subunit [Gemmataceae bacterium]|nr:HlyD family efflux transporter periplasmic adaptor subunit [Gemmataceae bacterium]
MNTTKLILILAIAFLLAGVGGAGWMANHFWSKSSHSPDAGSREGEPPDGYDSGKEGVVCTGYVDLEHGIRSLAPLRPGRVAAILANENEHVKAGTPILQLDDEDAKLLIEAAESAMTAAQIQVEEACKLEEQQRARLAQQQAALAAAGFRLDAARQMLRHKENQLKDKLVPDEEVKATRAEVKALEQQERAEQEKRAELKTFDPALAVRKAKAKLESARIQRNQARRQLDECTLKAPTAGTVQHIAVGVGDIVTANPMQPIRGTGVSPIVRFHPDEPLLVRAEVDQEFADRVQVGQPAVIRDDARSGVSWRGKVQRVAGWYEHHRPATQDPAAFTDVRTVECLLSIDPGQPPLRLGQRMRVMIGRVPSTEGN